MDTLKVLYKIIEQRKLERTEGSYTSYLFDTGLDKILKKCGEECAELIIAAKNGDKAEVIMETSDLFYHVLVLLQECGIELSDVFAELDTRAKKQGNLKNFKTVDKNT